MLGKSDTGNSVIVANETISKALRQYLTNKQGKHEIKELQKTATSDTTHMLRRVLT
jgi:protein required for attachment to host cells